MITLANDICQSYYQTSIVASLVYSDRHEASRGLSAIERLIVFGAEVYVSYRPPIHRA